MIMDQDESVQVPSIHNFYLEYLDKLQEDVIVDMKMTTSRRGDVEHISVGPKIMNTNKSQWIEIGKMREKYPYLFVD